MTWPYPIGLVGTIPVAGCFTGPLVFMPGYNCQLTQDDVRNQIDFMVVVGGGAGEPCSEVPIYQAGAVTSVQITQGGIGYLAAPTVSFVGGGGSGAKATAHLVRGSVNSITIDEGGSNYSRPPAVVFTGGYGIGATGIATIGQIVLSATLVRGGTGYTSPPLVTITGGGGEGAIARATIAGGAVTGIEITNHGSNYTTPPTITISGGGGTDAFATAVLAPSLEPPGDNLSGAPLCGEVVLGFNGQGGRLFTITGGPGVDIVPVPDEHKIIINVSLGGLLVSCFDTISLSRISESL
jgi:hypothetical protein